MAEIDIQKMIEDYNNISRHDYYGEASKMHGDGEEASKAAEEEMKAKNEKKEENVTMEVENDGSVH